MLQMGSADSPYTTLTRALEGRRRETSIQSLRETWRPAVERDGYNVYEGQLEKGPKYKIYLEIKIAQKLAYFHEQTCFHLVSTVLHVFGWFGFSFLEHYGNRWAWKIWAGATTGHCTRKSSVERAYMYLLPYFP